MRVAFVSYEYPPDTSLGGIATYVAQIAHCLARAGLEVEVFCGSTTNSDTVDDEGVLVHRLKVDRMAFPAAISPVFQRRHRQQPFDVIEGPDFLAEGRVVARNFPEVPYVVKLHTPFFFTEKFGRVPLNFAKVRANLKILWYVAKTRDFHALVPRNRELFRGERLNLLNADDIASPSRAIGEMIGRTWRINPARMSWVPYVYEPSPEMLAIPIETNTRRVTFVGRLEWRKGVQDLAPAIPQILKRQPETVFRFVGAIGPAAKPGMDMRTYILERVPAQYHWRLEFTGPVALNRIPQYLADTDICVFPSRWESFGFVVLEAMSAGRGIVCSDGSGMAELVKGGEYGLLVPPKSPRAIADRVVALLQNPPLRFQMAERARREGLERFSTAAVVPLQLQSYERAIARKGGRRPQLVA
jgi:glycogen synthase